MEGDVARQYGWAVVEPGEAVAGKLGTWTVTYTVGEEGMKAGGSLRIRLPWRGMVRWQPGHCIAWPSRPGAVCQVRVENAWPLRFHWRQGPIVHVDLWGEDLQPGDTITVVIGHRGAYSRGFFRRTRAQTHAQPDALWEFYVDVEGNKQVPPEAAHNDPYVQLEPFSMPVRAAEQARLSVVARQVAKAGDAARVVVVARDRHDNPCPQYAGQVRVDGAGNSWRVAVSGGRAEFEMTAPAGPVRLCAIDAENELIGLSNPLMADFGGPIDAEGPAGEAFPARGAIYFGDLHVMTGRGVIADAIRDSRQAMRWGREISALDFVAVCGHSLKEWDEELAACDEFYEPGEYVTIPVAEIAFRSGHKNVYFPNTVEAAEAPDASSPEALYRSLEGREALVIPHHTNVHSESSRRTYWREHDFSTHDPRFERLIEISQNRGSFEMESGGNVILGGLGSSVWSALQRGLKLGFVGGTDTHFGTPGEPACPLAGLDPEEDLPRGGLTAVYASELTREGIWAALKARRCYATQTQRTLLNFALGDYPLGAIVPAEEARELEAARLLRWRVLGHRPVVKVEVVRSDGRVFDVTPEAAPTRELIAGAMADEEPLSEIRPAGDAVFYYLRITEADGRMAWSSPIWLIVGPR